MQATWLRKPQTRANILHSITDHAKDIATSLCACLGMALAPADAALRAATRSASKTRCEHCKRLTITHLVEFAEVDLPHMGQLQSDPNTYFHHHDSIDALKISANRGCDFCGFIVDTLAGYEEDDEWTPSPNNWKGSKCDPSKSLFAAAQQLSRTNSSGRSHGATRDGITLLDTLIVQVGPVQGGDVENSQDENWEPPDFPHLCFKLVAPQRMPINLKVF
jgi:hypothetical protein